MPRMDLSRVADRALAMLRQSLDAFARLDVSEAMRVVKQDQAVDDEFRAIMRQLITFMMEDPRTITRSLEILFIAKAVERIGDHAEEHGRVRGLHGEGPRRAAHRHRAKSRKRSSSSATSRAERSPSGVGAFAEEMPLGLLHQVLARLRVGEVEAVLVHQHGLLLQPLRPGFLRDALPDALAERARDRAGSPCLRLRGRASRTSPFVPWRRIIGASGTLSSRGASCRAPGAARAAP